MNTPQRKNIVFSTTRQWNPGDEIILFGVQNILSACDIAYNPLIFNRNPDVRACFPDDQMFKRVRLHDNFHHEAEMVAIEANLRIGFFDNSIKPDSNYESVDWVVFAGTPEWCASRTSDLYRNIMTHNIPVMILGVGGGFFLHKESFREVIQKAKVLTVREGGTRTALENEGFTPIQLPCPALLSAPKDSPRKVEKVQHIGLVFQTTNEQSVIWSGCAQEAYDYQITLYQKILSTYGQQYKFSIVCHYIDELAQAKTLFPDLEVFYSYNAADYFDIYRRFDTVIGPRVHGIGAAASVGVPGMAISHDARGPTCEGFLASLIRVGDPLDDILLRIEKLINNAATLSAKLFTHKEKTMEAYILLVKKALQDPSVTYTNKPEPPTPLPFNFDRLTEIMQNYYETAQERLRESK
jgi:polysaccharide pyruvyl transferase WcaK-like protein